MRLLLSHQEFRGYGGTETYMLTVAQSLQRLGHEVLIFARALGPMAEFARGRGVVVFDDEGALPEHCDAVLAQDADTAHTLAVRYPQAARVFVTHSTDHLLQHPPQASGACQAVVVMNDRIARHVEGRAWAPRVVRLRQPIDLYRFQLSDTGVTGPRRVLVLSNYVKGRREEMIERACSDAGLEVAFAGVNGRPTPQPELAIAEADVVIGLGRGILEAMAAGRAAYVFGPVGGDGWVTPEAYPALEADGFSGRANGRIIDGPALTRDLGLWREDMGESNRDLAHAHHAAPEHALRLVELARSLGAPGWLEPEAALEAARLARLEQQAEAEGTLAEEMSRRARVQTEELRRGQPRSRRRSRSQHPARRGSRRARAHEQAGHGGRDRPPAGRAAPGQVGHRSPRSPRVPPGRAV